MKGRCLRNEECCVLVLSLGVKEERTSQKVNEYQGHVYLPYLNDRIFFEKKGFPKLQD